MGESLGTVVRGFLRQTNAVILVAWLVLAAGVRFALGSWSWWDLVVAAVLLAAQPFAEWAAHRYLMHSHRLRLGDRAISLPLRDEHVRHHDAPEDVHFMPVPIVLGVVALTTAAALVIMPTAALAATAVLVLAFELLVYVWVHYLLHTDYVPTTRWFRRQQASHLRHHRERHDRSFGVVTPIADIVLHTR